MSSKRAVDIPLGKQQALSYIVHFDPSFDSCIHAFIANSLPRIVYSNATSTLHSSIFINVVRNDGRGILHISKRHPRFLQQSFLSINLSKIEDTASGAVACQLMDYMFPGSIPMKRVNWEAKSDFQSIENDKIL